MKKNWLTGRVTGFDPIPRLAHIFALALALFIAPGAWADITQDNPVTGESETYINEFTGGTDGTATEWNDSANWNTGVKPFISGGNFNASLVYGKTATTTTQLEGWTPRIGAYNGAVVTFSGGINKIQNGNANETAAVWLTADASSSITIASFANKQLEHATGVFKLTSAKAGGITWNCGLTSTSSKSNDLIPFHYYIDAINDGTVVYTGDITVGNAQVIKQVNVKLTGTSQVSPKTLVTFGSGTTKTFTADAAIKVYDTDGTTLVETVNLATVNSTGATTLTTSAPVGSVELVQTSTGIVLYYVDGDPADVNVEEKTYKPSININFTDGAANGLTTQADVGLSGYEVPGTSWNNFAVANDTSTQTFGTVAAIDSTGAASTAVGVSVTVSNQRGRHQCSSLTPATDLRHGYIDDGAEKTTPTVTITGIPYDHYRVIVYHATDQDNAQFGYDTINGVNFTYVDRVQQKGATSWGASGASGSAEAIAEGVNTLVSSVMSGDTVTMVAHRIGGGSPSARGCFAAIQVVEYVPEVGENDLEIAVDGVTSYSVDMSKTLSGTVYLTGSGTLTLTGSEKITAAAIDVGKDVVLNIDTARLDATTFTGSGMVVYDGTAPVAGNGWADIGWSGTVWVKNQAVSNFDGNNFGNAASTIRFTGVTGYLSRKTTDGVTQSVPIELVDDGNTVAFSYDNGWGGSVVVVSTLKGTGTFKTSTAGNGEIIYFANADAFTGSFDLTYKKVQIGGSEPSGDNQNWNGRLYIPSGATVTQASGATWSAANSIDIQGTLYANGTLASSHSSKAVIGAGTVVFTGRAPTPTGNTWWKNSSWTGTTAIRNYSDWANIDLSVYGNSSSAVRFSNVSGWFKSGSATYDTTLELDDTDGVAFTHNDGYNNNVVTIKALKGSGTYYGKQRNTSDPHVTVVFKDAFEFTGSVKLNTRRVVFADSASSNDYVAGNIYVGVGFTFTVPNSNVAWYGTGGITLAGELKATSLNNLGGGTTVTTTDTGVFTLINSNDTQDHSVDYARITGTGTLRYADVSSKWRSLARTNFPTGMICENNLSAGLILTGTSDNTIGSLSGSGVMRSDWGGSANDNVRPVTILQAKDTVYSGVFHSDDRISTVTVAAGASTSGTLTLSGTQTVSNGLNVQAGVNLTGTWKGDTTVSGTFGGTGTLTGNLTFSDGATFKVFATDDDGLAVSGTVACPEEGTVTVDASALEDPGTYALLTASGLDADKFALAEGAPEGATLAVVEEVLTLTVPTPSVSITISEVANATVAVTVGGVAVTPENGVVTVEVGSAVVVTYTAAEGYTIANGTIEFTAAADTTTVDTTSVTVSEYIAWIYDENGNLVGDPYTAVQNAVHTFSQGTGNSIRFKTSIEESQSDFHAMLLKACNYNNETFTYTRMPSVAQIVIGQTTYPYTSLAAAVEDANDGDTITLLAGVTLDATIAIDKTLTLNLNDYTITASGINAITTSGTLTVAGSSGSVSVTSGNSVVLTSSAATLTVSGGATLSPTPTTNVARSRVKTVTEDGTTTYSVEAIPGTTFTVY